jgi:MFS family permease
VGPWRDRRGLLLRVSDLGGLTPCVGWLTDRRGPRLIIETGVVLMGGGSIAGIADPRAMAALLEPWRTGRRRGQPARLYGAIALTRWFVRRRGLALSIAFSGVGVGSVTILPWLQTSIANSGWRTACWSLGLLVLVALAPLNLLLRGKPADLGLEPDGDSDRGTPSGSLSFAAAARASADWTLGRAVRTPRFRWLALSYFWALFTWYAVQVHQSKISDGSRLRSQERGLGIRFGESFVAVPGSAICRIASGANGYGLSVTAALC